MKIITFLRQRLQERSTYMFIVGAMGSVSVLPVPFNWIGFSLLVIAAFVPKNQRLRRGLR